MSPSAAREAFQLRFGRACESLARAPGRVNIIGEHTDYHEGFVLPMAIQRATWVAVAPRTDGQARAWSEQLGDGVEWSVTSPITASLPGWGRYLAGAAELLRRRGARLGGFDLLVSGDVPSGAGLASSAALTLATVLALGDAAGEPLAAGDVVDICCTVEREHAGVPCGMMDPYASLHGQPGQALLLDCRTATHELVPCEPPGCRWIVVHSGVRHTLADGGYAERQRECRAALEYFRRREPQIRALRDVPLEALRRHASELDPLSAARCLHVAGENERVLAAVEALRSGDVEDLARLMRESHRSQRDDYEVSCRQVDALVELLEATPGVLAARLTGGGFGGSVLALCRGTDAAVIAAAVRERYEPAFEVTASVFEVNPGRGAAVQPLP